MVTKKKKKKKKDGLWLKRLVVGVQVKDVKKCNWIQIKFNHLIDLLST